jgi:hypothetical protein
VNEREPLFNALLRRTYTDSFDGLGDMDFTDYGVFATCEYCGWDSPCFPTQSEAQRARWRHPDVLCWLRALWIDWSLHPARIRLMLARRKAANSQTRSK